MAIRTFFGRSRLGRASLRLWHSQIRRSLFLGAIFAVAGTLTAHGQEKPLQIGVLALGPRHDPRWTCGQDDYQPTAVVARTESEPYYVRGLRDGLQKLNYVEGQAGNLGKGGRGFILEVRTGTLQQVREFAREFVGKKVDAIVAIATATVTIAKEVTTQSNSPIPILMTGVSQPVEEGFVQSLARPGGSITGVSHQLSQGSGKRVELFKEMYPQLRRLISMRRPGYSVSEQSTKEVRSAADRLKIDVVDWTVNSRQELQSILENVRPDDGAGILISPDSLIISNLDLVLETSLARRVPAFGLQDHMAAGGAIGAYGPSAFQAGARVASYIDKIRRGTKTAGMPVEPVDPTFVINLKAAECLGISPPLELLRQADHVIQ